MTWIPAVYAASTDVERLAFQQVAQHGLEPGKRTFGRLGRKQAAVAAAFNSSGDQKAHGRRRSLDYVDRLMLSVAHREHRLVEAEASELAHVLRDRMTKKGVLLPGLASQWAVEDVRAQLQRLSVVG